MAWEYSDKTKQLFMEAMTSKPGSHLGEIKDADAEGVNGSLVCGDALKLFFNVDKNEDPTKDRITEIRYQTFGCTSAIASSEALCLLIEERDCTPLEALAIKNSDIVNFLDGLPLQKIHCSVMGAEALRDAVINWAQKRGLDLKEYGLDEEAHEDDDGRMVCKCFNITEPFLRREIKELKLKTLDEVMNATKAGGACGTCQNAPGGIKDILEEIWGKEATCNKDEIKSYSGDIKSQVEQVVEDKVRPTLKLHGGDVSIVEVKGTMVYCTLTGTCNSCSGAQFTLKNVVEKELRKYVDSTIVVVDL